MADGDNEQKPEEKGGFFTGAANIAKTGINAIWGKKKLHYIQKGAKNPHALIRLEHFKNYIDLLYRRIEELRVIEQRAGEVNSKRKEIEEFYLKFGPYDNKLASREYNLFKWGHPDSEEGKEDFGKKKYGESNIVYEETTDEKTIEINRDEFRLSHSFPIPHKWPFPYKNGKVEEVSSFGKEMCGAWEDAYKGIINEMGEDVHIGMMLKLFKDKHGEDWPGGNLTGFDDYIRRRDSDPVAMTEADRNVLTQLRRSIKSQIESHAASEGGDIKEKNQNLRQNITLLINAAAIDTLKMVMTEIIEPACSKFYGFLKGPESIMELTAKAETLRASLVENAPDKIRHKHTYMVIQRLNPEQQTALRAHISPRERIGEKVVGLDENFKPLEVAGPEGYNYNGKKYPQGTVLIDIWDANDETDFEENKIAESEIRSLPEEHHGLIEYIDLLEMATYVHNEWDECRDDFRDGRYHPHSMLAVDYAMALNSDVKTEWKKGWDNKRESFLPGSGEKGRRYDIELGDGTVLKDQIRRGSNLSPAFDKTAWDIPGQKWEYIGKRYYYNTVNMTSKYYKWDQKDPMITTRGLSHYIIQKVIREMKYYEQANIAFRLIADKTGGYDYGPRRFGADFNKDPFNIDLSAVNEPLPSNLQEDAGKGAGRQGE